MMVGSHAGPCSPTLIPNSKSNDNIKRQSRSSASRRMTTKKQRQQLQQLQKRNAGSLHYGGKCAASGRNDGVSLIPKSNLLCPGLSISARLAEKLCSIAELDLKTQASCRRVTA